MTNQKKTAEKAITDSNHNTPTKKGQIIEEKLQTLGATNYVVIDRKEVHHGVYTAKQIQDTAQLLETYTRLSKGTKATDGNGIRYINIQEMKNTEKWMEFCRSEQFPTNMSTPDETDMPIRQRMDSLFAHKMKKANFINLDGEQTGNTLQRKTSKSGSTVTPVDQIGVWTTTKQCAVRTLDTIANLPPQHPIRQMALTIRTLMGGADYVNDKTYTKEITQIIQRYVGNGLTNMWKSDIIHNIITTHQDTSTGGRTQILDDTITAIPGIIHQIAAQTQRIRIGIIGKNESFPTPAQYSEKHKSGNLTNKPKRISGQKTDNKQKWGAYRADPICLPLHQGEKPTPQVQCIAVTGNSEIPCWTNSNKAARSRYERDGYAVWRSFDKKQENLMWAG